MSEILAKDVGQLTQMMLNGAQTAPSVVPSPQSMTTFSVSKTPAWVTVPVSVIFPGIRVSAGASAVSWGATFVTSIVVSVRYSSPLAVLANTMTLVGPPVVHV